MPLRVVPPRSEHYEGAGEPNLLQAPGLGADVSSHMAAEVSTLYMLVCGKTTHSVKSSKPKQHTAMI
eukprot:3676491-Heterocapsa_arctica.AAC.1